MSQTGATTEAREHDGRDRPPVKVTITITDPEGASETREVSIPSGPRKVPELKSELGVPPEASLWVLRGNDKPKQLVDHATHNVKAGDRFETVVKGGVS
jgi:hypothetical protein